MNAFPIYFPCRYSLIMASLNDRAPYINKAFFTSAIFMTIPYLKYNGRSIQTNSFFGEVLNMETPEQLLNISSTNDELSDSEELKDYLEAEQTILLASGTPYYLKYCKYYKSARYIELFPHPYTGITNHWIKINRLTEKNTAILDSYFGYAGEINTVDFCNYWDGISCLKNISLEGSINVLKRGINYMSIENIVSETEYKSILLKLVQKTVDELNNPQVYIQEEGHLYQGKRVFNLLKEIVCDSNSRIPFTEVMHAIRACKISIDCLILLLKEPTLDYHECLLNLEGKIESLQRKIITLEILHRRNTLHTKDILESIALLESCFTEGRDRLRKVVRNGK